MTRDVVTAILRRAGALVVTADSAGAAHQALAEFNADVILCDIAMPTDDGYAFLREYRQRGGTAPVIALTAFGRPEDREKALSSGFNAFLKKPVEPVVLARTVKEMV
jgi:CheY-like chemotaxis protein